MPLGLSYLFFKKFLAESIEVVPSDCSVASTSFGVPQVSAGGYVPNYFRGDKQKLVQFLGMCDSNVLQTVGP